MTDSEKKQAAIEKNKAKAGKGAKSPAKIRGGR